MMNDVRFSGLVFSRLCHTDTTDNKAPHVTLVSVSNMNWKPSGECIKSTFSTHAREPDITFTYSIHLPVCHLY